MIELVQVLPNMTKKKSVCTCKHTPVVSGNNDSDSDIVDTLATPEQPDEALSQESLEKNKKHAK